MIKIVIKLDLIIKISGLFLVSFTRSDNTHVYAKQINKLTFKQTEFYQASTDWKHASS